MRPDTHEALHNLMSAVEVVSRSYSELVDEGWETQICVISILRGVSADLGRLDNALESKAVKSMPENRVILGEVIAERLGGHAFSGWDHDEISRRLIEALTVDKTTGRVYDEETAHRLRGGFLYAARPNWRATALRDLGVEYEDCVDRRRLRRRLKIYSGA